MPPRAVQPGECKIDGCTNPKNTRYDRGIYAGLCADHIEARRARVVPPAPAPEPHPSRPEPGTPAPASEGFEARAQRLVEAGRSLDEARLALDAAHRVHGDAVSEWDAARAALGEES